MASVLGPNNYGKAEVRLVRVGREIEGHALTDLNVSVALAGDLADTHETGDNQAVLPTDTQKNTVFAFAREHGVGAIEEFGLRLARHFVSSQPSIHQARVSIEEYGWRRLGPHSFARTGQGVRTAVVTADASSAWVVSGLTDLVLMNTTDSEFHGFIRDRYTTLAETRDRILATAVTARWRYRSTDLDYDDCFTGIRGAMLDAFAGTHSLALQQTLYRMGETVLERFGEVAEVRLSLPNRHHFLQDLSAFGLDNPDVVYHADDRPYGLIEGIVERDDVPPAPAAWEGTPGFC